MKAILEFDLPEDNNQFKLACRGQDLYIDLYDIQMKIRDFDKYGSGIDVPEEDLEKWAKEISKLVEDIRSLSFRSTEGIE